VTPHMQARLAACGWTGEDEAAAVVVPAQSGNP
jgi:hypothetical protein